MMSSERLTEVVSARFTPSEAERLRELAGGGALSHVVRDLALQALISDRAAAPAWTPQLSTCSTAPGAVGSIQLVTDPAVPVQHPAPPRYVEVPGAMANS